nr:heavy metal translocating P-type ATPase [Caloramator mitchellensis]
MKKIYILDGLGCASCASKMEGKINELEDVENANIDFVNKTLSLELSKDASVESILDEVSRIVKSIEPDVVLSERVEDDLDVKTMEYNKKELIPTLAGLLIFIAAYMFKGLSSSILFIVSYSIIGYDVIFKAIRNIKNREVFDENFLMTIATLGAFSIGEMPEAVSVMLFYKIGEYLQDLAVEKSRRSIKALLNIRPDYANLLVGGKEFKVEPRQVRVDNIIIVKPGERIPLDGVIIEGESTVDTSALTGESIPRDVEVGSEVLSGFINKNGLLKIKVTKNFKDSTVNKILELVENANSKKSRTENFITKFAKIYTPIVVAIAALIVIIPVVFYDGSFQVWLYRGLIFLVVSCPCALVISIPLGFFGGIGAASRRGILIKGSNYLEALKDVSTVVFDKTGTLTKGKFRVNKVISSENWNEAYVLEFAALAESYSNHPIAISILNEFNKEVDKSRVKDYKEISGFGVSAIIDNKKVLVGNAKLMIQNGIKINESSDVGTLVYVAIDDEFAGCLVISDEIKNEAIVAVKTLKEMGIKTIMLTGDSKEISKDVAEKVCIDKFYYGLLPNDKVEKLEELEIENENGKILFVGDGINDAPVIARADVGVAMGALGSDAAIEAADVVLMDDDIRKIITSIEVARRTRKIVYQNIALAIGVKIIVMVIATFGVATMWEAVFADVGVALLAVLNSIRVLKTKP